jgi:prepilin-type N-terminal cleavage/methylation domain-containing protein
MSRRGFSLAELMVALVIAGVIGVALTRLVVSQARFVAKQDGYMKARSVARAGLAVLADELRQVGNGGVVQASVDSVTLRVPFAYGVACGQSGGTTFVALMPPDSARLASSVTAGYAWRDTAFVWRVVEPATSTPVGLTACSTASPAIAVLSSPSAATYGVAVAPNVVATTAGSPVYLFQQIKYVIDPSTVVPWLFSLYREVVGSGVREEIVTPFDSVTRFEFLVGSLRVPQSAVPGSLDSIVGLRVFLGGSAETTPSGMNLPPRFMVQTDIVFRNNVQ